MKKNFQIRLQNLISELNISNNQFAKSGGISKGALSSYFNADRLPKADTLAAWVNEYDINANWLLTGKGNMFQISLDEDAKKNKSLSDDQTKSIIKAINNLKAHNEALQVNLMSALGATLQKTEKQGVELYCSSHEATARFYSSEQLIVCAGSKITKRSKHSLSATAKKAKSQLKALGWLQDLGGSRNELLLLRDSFYLSPSASAGLVAGCNKNGRKFWKVKENDEPLEVFFKS